VANGWFKKLETIEVKEPVFGAAEAAAPPQMERNDRKSPPPLLVTLEQVYENATIKAPKIRYGIQKVTEMAGSPHLADMSPEFKRKALLMALTAADTDEGQVLNDLVIRQRALKEYEDSFQDRLDQYEAAQMEQNRIHQSELDKITSQFKARIQANVDEVERRQKEFRSWQDTKRQELQRFTETAALCVQQESPQPEKGEKAEDPEPVSNVTPILRAASASR
jgi:hypothetical protein